MDDRLDGQTAAVPRGISGYDWVPANDLTKVMAMVLMVIDHIAWAFSRHPDLWRALGRGSFPLFAALLVVGMRRTRSPRRYLARLSLFALVSQYPFALCFEGLNIGFTLAIGGLGLYAGEDFLERNQQGGHPLRGWLGWTASMGAAGIVAGLLRTDYGGMGLLAMAILQRSPTAAIGIPLMMGWTVLFSWLHQWEAAYWGTPVVGAVLLFGWTLRGWKQRFLPRWFFYAFYPVHLTIIGLILATGSPGPAEEPAILTVQEDARPLRENPPQAQAHDSRSHHPERQIGQAQRRIRGPSRTDARPVAPERPGSNPKVLKRVRIEERGHSTFPSGKGKSRMSPFPAVVWAGPKHPRKNGHVPEPDAGVAGMGSVLVFLRSDS